jgi:hypothetical protein
MSSWSLWCFDQAAPHLSQEVAALAAALPKGYVRAIQAIQIGIPAYQPVDTKLLKKSKKK